MAIAHSALAKQNKKDDVDTAIGAKICDEEENPGNESEKNDTHSQSFTKKTKHSESTGIPNKIQFIEGEQTKIASSEMLQESELTSVSDQELVEKGTQVQSTEPSRRSSIMQHVDSLILIECSISGRINSQKVRAPQVCDQLVLGECGGES